MIIFGKRLQWLYGTAVLNFAAPAPFCNFKKTYSKAPQNLYEMLNKGGFFAAHVSCIFYVVGL